MVLEAPGKGEGIQVEINGESKTVVHWINCKARQRLVRGGRWRSSKKTAGVVGGKADNLKERESDWAVHILQMLMHGPKMDEGRKGRMGGRRSGQM